MTSPKMPRDGNNHPIPALRPSVARKGVTIDAAPVRIGPFTAGCKVISIFCRDGALRFQTGNAAVDATVTSHFIASGERQTISLVMDEQSDTHISIIRATDTNATLEVSELQ